MSDLALIKKRYDELTRSVQHKTSGTVFRSRLNSLNASIKDYNYEHKTNIRTRQVGTFGRNYDLLGMPR